MYIEQETSVLAGRENFYMDTSGLPSLAFGAKCGAKVLPKKVMEPAHHILLLLFLLRG